MEELKVKLSGVDGNAFAIMGACRAVHRAAGGTDKNWDEIMSEMTSGDYDHLLQVVFKYFEVE